MRATQFVRVLEHLGNQDVVLPLANQFFAWLIKRSACV
jgi:hypothetical protein